MRMPLFTSITCIASVWSITRYAPRFKETTRPKDPLIWRVSGSYDIVVTDGFAGNVLVKTTEGTAIELLKKLKKDIYSRTLYKLGALLMKRMFLEEKEFMNYQNYGGSVLLGTQKVVVKGHGSSKAVAVEKCIEQAYKMEISRLSEKIEAEVAKYEHYED